MSSVRRICPHCGEPYAVTADRCPRCGRLAEAAVSPPARRPASALIARAAVPVALGVVGLAARAGLALVRKALTRAIAPAPTDLPARPLNRPHIVVHFWQRREVEDAAGRHAWEETRARWEIEDRQG